MSNEEMVLQLQGMIKDMGVRKMGGLFEVVVTLQDGKTFTGSNFYEADALSWALMKSIHHVEGTKKRESDLVEALLQERASLEKLIEAVRFSLGSSIDGSRENYDLREQLHHMESYSWVVHRRICRARNPT